MNTPSDNPLKNPNIDMDQICCSLKDQSIPEYGKGSSPLDRKWMQIEIVQPTLPDGCQLSINYSAKTTLALNVGYKRIGQN